MTARRLSVLDWRTLEIELEAARADVERELAEDGDALPPATAAAFAEVARVVRLSLAREAALQALEHKQNATQGAA